MGRSTRYTLVFGGFLLLGGRAADLLGRRRLFVVGIVIFSVASLVNGLAQPGGMLIVARALQGLGAALISPAALSIITTTFAEGEERTKALGVWGAIAAGGAAFGLLLGGILTDTASWRVELLRQRADRHRRDRARRSRLRARIGAPDRTDSVDLAGAVRSRPGLMVLVYAIVKAAGLGLGLAETLALGAVAVALLVAFVFMELRSSAPLVRLDIFKHRARSGAPTR